MAKKEQMEKQLNNGSSRLDSFKTGSSGTIAGISVSETQDTRERKKNDRIVNTSIRIRKDLKDKAMALCALKQVSFTRLIEIGLENQIRYNADLINKFTKYKIETEGENL